MNPLNAFAVSGLIIAVIYLPFSIFVLKNGKKLVAKLYCLFLFSIAMWGVGSTAIALIHDVTLIKLAWKITYGWVICVAVFFYHSMHELNQRKTKWDLFLIYGQAAFFLIAICKDALMVNFQIIFNEFYYHIATPFFTASFVIWIIIISAATTLLFLYYKGTFPEDQSTLKFIIILMLIGFVGGITNFLPAYNTKIYPYGNFIVFGPGLALSYSILKHQFLDIRVILKKSLIYSFSVLSLSLFYIVTVLTFEKIFQGYYGYHSASGSIMTAFLIGICFFPFHKLIQKWVDKVFFKKQPHEIADENELLRQELTQTEKLRTVATLASGMAHEIKNPLTAIKTFSEHLPTKMEDKEFLSKFSRIVGHEVNRIDDLVNQLLDFAKPAPLSYKSTNLNQLIRDTLNFLNSSFIKHGLNVVTELPESCEKEISLDPIRIRQALLNILLNAIDASLKGGTITVATQCTDKTVTIQISDTGIGIPAEDIPHIFDPFYSKKDSGSGLGLTITHGIITEHGGQIRVQSQPGEGTTFLIELPVDKNRL